MPYIYHIEPASMKHDANLDSVPCPVMYYGNMITHLILLYSAAMTCHTIQSRYQTKPRQQTKEIWINVLQVTTQQNPDLEFGDSARGVEHLWGVQHHHHLIEQGENKAPFMEGTLIFIHYDTVSMCLEFPCKASLQGPCHKDN